MKRIKKLGTSTLITILLLGLTLPVQSAFTADQPAHPTLYVDIIEPRIDDNLIEIKGADLRAESNVIIDGSVGIGTSLPSTELEVVGTTLTNKLRLADTGGNTVHWDLQEGPNNELTFTYNNEMLRIHPQGNVGIGTDSPDYKLVVGGTSGANTIKINDIDTADWLIGTGGFGLNFLNDFDNDGNYNNRVFFSKEGRVGIGTTSPQQLLDVAGTIRAENFLKADGTPIGGPQIQSADVWQDDGTNAFRDTGRVGIGTDAPEQTLDVQGTAQVDKLTLGDTGNNNVQWDIEEGPTNELTFTYGNERIRIVPSGNLGIGSTNPQQRLTVRAPSGIASKIEIDQQDQRAWHLGSHAESASFNIHDASVGQDRLTINGQGNVGIGTSSPSQKLDVVGNILASKLILRDTGGNAVSWEIQEETNNDLSFAYNGEKISFTASGNVGIGPSATNPLYKLNVLGKVNAEQLCIAGDCKDLWPTTGTSTVSSASTIIQAMPTGSVMHFRGTTCPEGWNELTGARGRTLVGLQPSGTLEAAVGTPLNNLENRAAGQHTHTADTPPHGHTIDPPNAGTSGAGDHQHGVYHHAGFQGGDRATQGAGSGDTTTQVQGGITSPAGAHSHTIDITPFSSIVTDTEITVANAGSVVGTNAPYLQLLTCVKSDTGGPEVASASPWQGSNGNIFYDSGNVGIGTTTPSEKLEVAGTVRATKFMVDGLTSLSTSGATGGDDIGLFTGDGSEKLTITNQGNVGIGTINPTRPLHVIGSARFESVASDQAFILFEGNTGKLGYVGTSVDGGLASGIANGDTVLRAEGGKVHLATTSVPGLTISTSANRVGIGTTNPPTKLTVHDESNYGDGSLTGIVLESTYVNGKFLPGLTWSTTNDNPTRPKASISVRETGGGTFLRLGTSSSYATGVNSIVEIDPLGNIFTRRGAYFDPNLAPAGANNPICFAGSGQFGTCSSSIEYKRNVKPLQLNLETIEQLNPVTFNWKDTGRADLGFIAEEIEQINPLLADYDQEGELVGVKYKQLTAVLTNAVKELNQQNQQQQAQIDALEKRLAALE